MKARGTLFSASSASVKMVGTAMSASRQPAVKTFSRSLIGKERNPLHERQPAKGAHRLTEHRNAEKAEDDGGNRRDEFDVRFDQAFLRGRRDFAHVNGAAKLPAERQSPARPPRP